MEGDKEFLDSLETQIEYFLCKRKGISQEQVLKFEKRFNQMKEKYPDLVGEMEAKEHEFAPNNKEYLIAQRLVRWLEDQLKVEDQTTNPITT